MGNNQVKQSQLPTSLDSDAPGIHQVRNPVITKMYKRVHQRQLLQKFGEPNGHGKSPDEQPHDVKTEEKEEEKAKKEDAPAKKIQMSQPLDSSPRAAEQQPLKDVNNHQSKQKNSYSLKSNAGPQQQQPHKEEAPRLNNEESKAQQQKPSQSQANSIPPKSQPAHSQLQSQQSKSNALQLPGKKINKTTQKPSSRFGSFDQNAQQLKPQPEMKINCSLQDKLFALPTNVQYHIISFLINDYKNIKLVSPLWYYKINELFQQIFEEIDNKFIKRYINILSFKNSYLSFTPIKVQKKRGYRLDWNIIAEILPTVKNQSATISYTFRTHKESTNPKKYQCQYRYDSQAQRERQIWCYREECKHNFDDNKQSFVQPIAAASPGDNIKIAVNFYNMSGLIDISSIEWKKCKFSEIQRIPISIDYNELPKYEKNRICEVEEIYTNWVVYDYFTRPEKIKLDIFEPYLQLVETRCAGVDIITSKMVYRAKTPGRVQNSLDSIGIQVIVVEKNKEVTVESKKIGLFFDLESILELRVGDLFVVYISKGD